MFSHNGKISEKQMRRMLVLPVFASSIFVIPYLSARLFEASIVPGLLVFFVFACIYVACIYMAGEWYEKRGNEGKKNSDTKEGKLINGFLSAVEHNGMAGRMLLIVQVLRGILRLAFYVVLSIAVLGEAQVPFMHGKETDTVANLLVVLPLLLVALYGADVVEVNKWKSRGKGQNQNGKHYLGVEKQGRIHELMFWVLFIPFIIVILFGLKEVDYSIFAPHLDMSWNRMFLCGYALLTFILPVENYLYLRPDLRMQKNRQTVWTSYFAVLLVVVLTLVLTLLLLGIYGVHGAGEEEMVTIAIMRYIRLPFGILERFDMLMVWFFMTGCFLLICGTLYYTGYLLSFLVKKVKRCLLLLAVLGIVLVAVAFLPAYPDTLQKFLWYGAWVDIPLSLIIPLLGMFLVRWKEGGGKEDE